jgi:DNA polymerase-3 subunit epsilon
LKKSPQNNNLPFTSKINFMKFLFFDCETTGKPLRYGASYSDLGNWPRVTQLAWILTDSEGVVLHRQGDLVQPDGWEIPNEPFFINNNMSTERCQTEGRPVGEVLDAFIATKHLADVLVGHNLTSFDHPVVWAEILRSGRQPRSGMHKICTMKESTAYCRIPNKPDKNGRIRGGAKWPTLQELHNKLFSCEFESAHDAMADIEATAKCFFELVRLEVIQLPAAVPQTEANA